MANSTYSVTTSSGICFSSATHDVTVSPLPVANINLAPTGVPVLFESNSLHADSIWWDFGDGSLGTGEIIHHGYEPGTYTATMIAINDCGSDTATIEIFEPVGIGDTDATNVSVFPNPSSGSVAVVGATGSVQIHIHDLAGNSVLQTRQATFSIGELAPGIYLLEIEAAGNISHHRLVRQ